MEDVLQAVPQGAQDGDSVTEENINDVVSEFFDLVGGSRIEDNILLDLHLPTGDIIARHEENDSIARLTFEGGLSAEEMQTSDFFDIRTELERISRPTSEEDRTAFHD